MTDEIMDYFPERPWYCRCGCGFGAVSPDLVRRLNLARHLAGVPFEIRSACRCGKHNASEGGKDQSAHLTGEAADIGAVNSVQRYRILVGLMGASFRRIGIGADFIHADVAAHLPQEVIWTYK